MKHYIVICVYILLLYPLVGYSQLIINEVSQGPSGSKEYVEFMVLGSGCNSCVDIRGWIFDDNNGWHDSPIGTGQGIAPGCMRFSYDAQWACVPAGTMIVIYNSSDPNGSLPADDPTDANNDCVYIIPSNTTTLIDYNSTEPNNTSLIDYASITFSPGGSWTTTSMNNSNDSYQIIDPNNTSAPYFSIGWGNNDEMQDVYFSGSASGNVMYMTNSVDDDPFNSANWVSGDANSEQTPGAPNNAANATWIAGLSNNCSPVLLQLDLVSITEPLCNGDCNGSATIVATGGSSPYTYQWDDPANQTNATATGLCAGTYYPCVTDASGCVDTLDTAGVGVVITEPLALTAPVSGGVSPCSCPCSGYVYVFPTGGTPNYTVGWSNGYADQFQTGLCDGTYDVTVTDANGCITTNTITIP